METFLRGLSWVEIELSAEEEDADSVVFEVSEAREGGEIGAVSRLLSRVLSVGGRRVRTAGRLGGRGRLALAVPRAARRAPEVTVTGERNTLCQKGCYPMALLFSLVSVLSDSVVHLGLRSELKRAGGRAASLSSRPPAVEYPGPSGGYGGGRVVHSRSGSAWRIASISLSLRSISCLSANGFSCAFSVRKRRLVCSVTSLLASTRARGVRALG